MPSSNSPVLRQTLIVLAFLALVGLFFAVNYFIIIPRQRQAYNKEVFRVLKEVSADFGKRIADKADSFAKNRPGNDANKGASKATAKRVAQNKKGSGQIISQTRVFRSFEELNGTSDTSKNYPKQYSFKFNTLHLTLVKSTADKSKKLDTLNIPIRDVLEPTVQLLHKDLFDLVMLVKRDTIMVKEEKKTKQVKDQILYKFGEQAAGDVLPGDSLFKEPGFGQFSSISDLTIAGTSYKAFALPFRFAGDELVLAGFIPERVFKARTNSYPKPTLLFIIFLLTAFILSLPLIKIYLGERQERITTNDLRGLMVAFVSMPFVVVLTGATLLLYKQIDEKTDKGLRDLHNNIEGNFLSEVNFALKQLKRYDTLLKTEANLRKAFREDSAIFQKSPLLNKDTIATTDFKDTLLFPSVYQTAEDVFWVDKKGMQIAKWSFFKNVPVSYFDLAARNYFQKMRDNRAFVSANTDKYYVEPTISWSVDRYTVNILAESHQHFSNPDSRKEDSAIMIGLSSTNMHSVCNPVVLKGYNFCIINESGKILFHSETERSLHEYLFEESNLNFDLMSAVKKKDSALIPDARLFDRSVKMLVAPVQGMPSYFLVTYFNKREQNLFVFHVSAFVLLCTSLTLFGVLLFALLHNFFGSGSSANNIYTYQSAWMKPSPGKANFYRQNIAYQGGIVIVALFFWGLMALCRENCYWYLLQASILLPFFVVTGYLLLRKEFGKSTNGDNASNQENSIAKEPGLFPFKKEAGQTFACIKRNAKSLGLYFLAALLVLLVLNSLQSNLPRLLSMPVLFIVFLTLLVPFLAGATSNFTPKKSKNSSRNYLTHYAGLILLSTFVVGVLPALGIYSFAVHEEKQMWIKAAQFEAAQKIENRRDTLNKYFKTTKFGGINPGFVKECKLSEKKGIYLLHGKLEPAFFGKKNPEKDTITHSPFYQAVARFLFLPKDHMDFFDNNASYCWYKDAAQPKQDINLAYKNETDRETPDDIIISHDEADSNLLAGLFSGHGKWLIFCIVTAFFYFQFKLIKAVTEKVFLLSFFIFEDDKSEPEPGWVNQFLADLSLTEKDKKFLNIGSGGLTSQLTRNIEKDCVEAMPKGDEAISHTPIERRSLNGIRPNRWWDMAKGERILHLEYLLTPAYNAIWNKLKSNERFVLYDFALDGFTNYKNIDIIYRLYQWGLIRKNGHQLELMSYNFRSYLLGKAGTKEILNLEQQQNTGSTWKSLRNIFFILALAILIFLFITQQDVSNRILVIVSGLATLVPGLLKIFDRSGSGGEAKK